MLKYCNCNQVQVYAEVLSAHLNGDYSASALLADLPIPNRVVREEVKSEIV
jgi:hypothetical protein